MFTTDCGKHVMLGADGVSNSCNPAWSAMRWVGDEFTQQLNKEGLAERLQATQNIVINSKTDSKCTALGSIFDPATYLFDWVAIGDSYLIAFDLDEAREYFKKQKQTDIKRFTMLINYLHCGYGYDLASVLHNRKMPQRVANAGKHLCFYLGQDVSNFNHMWQMLEQKNCQHYGQFEIPYSKPVILMTSDGVFDCLQTSELYGVFGLNHAFEVIMAVVIYCYTNNCQKDISNYLIALATGHGHLKEKEPGEFEFIGNFYDRSCSIGKYTLIHHHGLYGRCKNNIVKDDFFINLLLPEEERET